MSRVRRVGIVGGGISGLSAAYYLKKKSSQLQKALQIQVIEREKTLGGVIRSEQEGDFLLEWGPEGFVSYKQAAVRLVKELGVGDELLGSNDYQRKNYVVLDGQLLAYPDGMAFLSPVRLSSFWRTAPLSLRGKLRVFLEPFISPSNGDLSVSEFFERRLGREFTERLVEPMVGAIYAANINELSTVSALPEMRSIEQQYRSLWRGLRKRPLNGTRTGASAFLTLRAGMQRLVEALENALPDVEFLTGTEVLRVAHEADGRIKIETADFSSSYDYLIVTTPAPVASRLLRDFHRELSARLGEILYSSSTLVYLAYPAGEVPHPLDGFGFIVSAAEAEVLDACTWVHRKFDGRCPENFVLLRCAIHDGRRARESKSDDELIQLVHEEMGRLLGVSCDPILTRVRHLGRALPKLLVGHSERLKQIRRMVDAYPELVLSGAYYGGVGIPECISAGEAVADRILTRLDE